MRKFSSGGYLALAVIVCAGLFIFAENLLIYKFQECVATKTSDSRNDAGDQKPKIVIIFRVIESQTICTIRTLDKHNGFFAALAGLAVALFTFTLWRSTKKLWEASRGQSEEMQASIAEAKRSAIAMENVAASLKINADKIVESVEINRGIAERQKLLGELQTRAYVAVNFIGVVPQNREANFRLEPRLKIICNGLTPAYRLKARLASDFLPFPLREDFEFPLSDFEADASTGMLGPRNDFIISAPLPKIYSDEEIENIKRSINGRVYVWGEIIYEDAFEIPRHVRFAQHIVWMSDGSTTTSFNTSKHNDAD